MPRAGSAQADVGGAVARAAFPRGLEQPAHSLRFGADALLLAAYAARRLPGRPVSLAVAELGCGCGAALLGLALRRAGVRAIGMDCEQPLVAAAQSNARALGLAGRLRFACADAGDLAALRRLPHPAGGGAVEGGLDAVLANPPFGVGGRPSPSPLREAALRAGPDCLPRFCRAAAFLLRHGGQFFCVFHAPSLPRLCAALDAAGLGLRHLLPLRARAGRPALRVLAEARKDAAHDVVLDAPLSLHGPRGGEASRWSAAALRFCPWLA